MQPCSWLPTFLGDLLPTSSGIIYMLSRCLVATALHVLKLQMGETASSHEYKQLQRVDPSDSPVWEPEKWVYLE